jgi:hypothetical protein
MKPRSIVPVPPDLIGIYQVREDEPLLQLSQRLVDGAHAFRVVTRVDGGDRAAREKVIDLAYSATRNTARRERV